MEPQKKTELARSNGKSWDFQGQVLLVVTVDAECDKVQGWKPQFPLSFRSITEGMAHRLQPLFESYGIRPTYLLSPEVLRDASCQEVFTLMDGKAEFGAHLHGEQFGSEEDILLAGPGHFQCEYSSELEYERMSELREIFVKSLGKTPVSFRAGRFGARGHTIKCLQDLGYRNDCSVTPHLRWGKQPGKMDFIFSPEQPYFASFEDIGHPGDSSIVEIPISIGSSSFGDWLRSRYLLEHGQSTIKRAARRITQPIWLRPTLTSTTRMYNLCDDIISKHRNRPFIVLNMFLHAGEVVAGASPYSLSSDGADLIYSRLESICSHLVGKNVIPVTLQEAGEHVRRLAATNSPS